MYPRFVMGLAVIACVALNTSRIEASDLRLTLVEVDAARRPTLSLSGLTSGHYGLEASTNLTQWFSLTSAPAAAGPLSFVHPQAVQLGTVYYRGVQLAEVLSPAVQPQADSNRVATGLITVANGGSLVLTDEAGVRFTFTVGPSNVIETVPVRMQLITNFTAFPYNNAMRTAVIFEPSGFEFDGAGLLEILYPTNIPFLKISSFAFDGDGSGFHLTPDLVATDRVRIPVTHFSGVGTGLWAPTDRTTAVTTHIERTLDAMSQDLAGILGRDRDRQLQGEEPQSNLSEEFERRRQDYYDNYLKPFFAEAGNDCALAQSITRHILGIGRQGELLGAPRGPVADFLGSATLQTWSCNCVKEAIKACEDGKISDRTLIRTLLGIERQAQLLGGGSTLEACGLGSLGGFMDKLANQTLPCVPEWLGVISYSDGGSRTWDCSGGNAGTTCSDTTATALSFEAEVERVEMKDESFLPFFSKQTWTLKLFPQASGSFSHDSTSTQKLSCGATSTTTHHINGANSGPLDLEATFTFEDGALTAFTLDQAAQGSLLVPTTEISKGVTTPCDSGGTGSSSSHVFYGSISLSPEPVTIDEVSFTQHTPTALEGSARATRIGLDGIIMPFSWTFSLRRHAPPN